MPCTSESLLLYPGINGCDGICHVRIYEEPGQLPVAIVGQLEDNPGTAISMAIEMIASEVQRTAFPDGREFRLVSHHSSGPNPFMLVRFAHRTVAEDPDDPAHYTSWHIDLDSAGNVSSRRRGPTKSGDFRDPRWEPIDDIDELVGCEVRTWPRGEYTAANLFGADGERLRAESARRVRLASDLLMEALRERP